MGTYICLLRGINVSGQRLIKMTELVAVYEALKCRNVRTYVQSGNVVFDSVASDSGKLAASIEQRIADEFGFPVSVLIRKASDLARVLKRNPFLSRKDIDASKLHVTFLNKAPTKEQLCGVEAVNAGMDEFLVSGKEVFLYCPGGYGKTKLTNNFFEKKFRDSATTRNWNTINRLCEMTM